MRVERATLEASCADLNDGELLRRIGSGELTELALDVAITEAGKRGLYLEALRENADAEGVEVARGHGPLCICARYLLPLDAQVLAARLQAEGLTVHVMDSEAIYASGALFTLARGGVRVMVPESQLEDAKRIRASYDAGEYAIDEDFDVDS